MSTFLTRALALRENGYQVVPVKKGTKAPKEDGWQNHVASQADIKKWAANGYADGNIGINTRHTPAVDIDITDKSVAEEMEKWILSNLGNTIVRVGRAPKRLLVFRTDKPFRKLFCEFSDGENKQRIEILGSGQQFIAYGVHPDTKKPYTWTSLDEPLDLKSEDLYVLHAEDAELILDQFEKVAKKKGWSKVRRSGGQDAAEEGEEGDGLINYKPVLPITEDKIEQTLNNIPNDDADYDRWLTVGMALHHQFGGETRGLELWHEWSEQSSKHEGALLNSKWSSFGHGPDTATFATLVYWAKENEKKEAAIEFDAMLKKVRTAAEQSDLMDKVLPKLAKLGLTDLQVDIAVVRIQERLQELTNTKPRLETVRKAFRAAQPKTDLTKYDLPKWCENWVFVTCVGKFYNFQTGEKLGLKNFDAAYGDKLLTDQHRASGESFGGRASDVALNLHNIPKVYDFIYMPGEGRFMTVNRKLCVNTYDSSSVPAAKEPRSKDDHDAIAAVEKHFENLFPNERERTLFLDYLCYNVQFPAEKITWGCLIQGVDGAGKSWMSGLMAVCLGGENIRTIHGSSLKEQFTSWAEGRKMVFIEEIRLHDNNRFDILDKMKGYVTDKTVPVRRMQTDGYEVPNVTNYVMFTNYWDALPINKNDRRYYIISTSFQTKSHIDEFSENNPTYFEELYSILDFNGEALRWWMLNRTISDAFKPKSTAPSTETKDLMRELSESSDDMDEFETLLSESKDPLISEKVLSASKLRELGLFGTMSSRALGAFLARAGFAVVGRYRIFGRDDDNSTYYTRKSQLFAVPDRAAAIKQLIAEADDGFD